MPSTFRKAFVSRGDEPVEVDWAADSAFRFFPIERDPVLGWRLHFLDMATNKALALSARTETRDDVDIVELDAIYPLSAICWAACGKDPGFSPLAPADSPRPVPARLPSALAFGVTKTVMRFSSITP